MENEDESSDASDNDSEVSDSEDSDAEYERRFEYLCACLQRNDPSVTEVYWNDFNVRVTNARARRLGEALQGNPHVDCLSLDIFNLEEGEGVNYSLEPLHRFIRESSALRKVTLKASNFDTTTPVSILQCFLLTIAENPCIEELTLDRITVRPEGFDVLMKTTQSLKN
jgi:hypothetical protein